MYNKMHRLLPLVDFYNTRPWEFKTAGLVELQSALSEEDARTFNFDVRLIDWVEYLRTYVLGVRQFIHKEDLTTLPAARRSLQMWVLLVPDGSTTSQWVELKGVRKPLSFLWFLFRVHSFKVQRRDHHKLGLKLIKSNIPPHFYSFELLRPNAGFTGSEYWFVSCCWHRSYGSCSTYPYGKGRLVDTDHPIWTPISKCDSVSARACVCLCVYLEGEHEKKEDTSLP